MNKEDLIAMKDISIFYQYLALGETITFNNGLADFELTMSTEGPNYNIFAKNMNFPEIKPILYDDMLFVGNILGIIDYLKKQPSKYNPQNKKCSAWEDIRVYTAMTVSLNEENLVKRRNNF